jgi:acetoin utilization protein AcuB
MQATACRHLPVVHEGKLVGLVSQRGLYRLETLVEVDRAKDPVVDAMDVPYVVEPETPLLAVAEEMERRKAGACVVARGGKVVGIFTTNDALTALAAILSATAGTRRRKDSARA